MLFTKKFNSLAELRDHLNGTPVARGAAGTNAAGSPNLQDLTVDAFLDVVVGDRIYISGELTATVFLVLTKTNNNNLVLDTNIVAAHALGPTVGKWRAVKNDALAPADVVFGGPIIGPTEAQGYLVYEDPVFG